MEEEPGPIWRADVFTRANSGVMMIAVEEGAVRRQVVEHAVEDDLDTTGVGIGDEFLEVAVRSKVVADGEEIAGIVAMVRTRFENRIEIDDRDAQALQVV